MRRKLNQAIFKMKGQLEALADARNREKFALEQAIDGLSDRLAAMERMRDLAVSMMQAQLEGT